MSYQINPFTCYFCNKLVENDTEFGHVSSCGSVLEPCVNKCGSYIPRNMKTRHMKECKNKPSRSMVRLNSEGSDKDNFNIPPRNNTGSLGRHHIRNNVTPSNNFELSQLMIKYQNLDYLSNQLMQNIGSLKMKQQEYNQAQKTSQIQTQMHLEKLHYQNQLLVEWKRNIELKIENLKREMITYGKNQNDVEDKLKSFRLSEVLLKETEKELNLLKEQLRSEQLHSRESINELREKLNQFKDYLSEENTIIAAIWNDHKLELEKLSKEVQSIHASVTGIKTRQTSLTFDVKTVTQISAETADKLEIQERLLGSLQKEFSQIKLDIQSLEDASSSAKNSFATPGRLLWKIQNISTKMESAKELDTVLKSPIFYTHDYGYKIRIFVYLNGIKKWKGRHMIACIHVLQGEHDLLLKWPCHIEGTMILRDLYNYSNPVDFSKYIAAKRHSGGEENEEPQESSAQYIFIPHTTLLKQNFIKEDIMFIDVRINSVNRLKDETEF